MLPLIVGASLIAALTLGFVIGIVAAAGRSERRHAKTASKFETETVQMCAHILAADTTGWTIPEHIVDLAKEVLHLNQIQESP